MCVQTCQCPHTQACFRVCWLWQSRGEGFSVTRMQRKAGWWRVGEHNSRVWWQRLQSISAFSRGWFSWQIFICSLLLQAATRVVKVSANHGGLCGFFCSGAFQPPPHFFFSLSPEQNSKAGLLKQHQPSLLFQSFCSRQLFSLLSLRRLPFYVELISFLELCEQS